MKLTKEEEKELKEYMLGLCSSNELMKTAIIIGKINEILERRTIERTLIKCSNCGKKGYGLIASSYSTVETNRFWKCIYCGYKKEETIPHENQEEVIAKWDK